MARVVAIGYPHHITQRGNYKQVIFIKDNDYRFYLEHFKKYCSGHDLFVLAYCLMPNHVHFVAIPEKNNSLSKTFNACHMKYAHYFNKKKDLIGHLWQGRFYSCVLDQDHLYYTVRYVENNPVRAKLVKEAGEWTWSSAREHLKGEKGIVPLVDANKYFTAGNWQDYLSQKDDQEIIKAIRAQTLTGRPLGNNAFIEKLEKLLGKRLRAMPRGRPRKRR